MQIRLAEPADDRAVTALRRTWFEEFAGHPIADAGFEDECAAWFEAERDRGITWLAIEHDEIVGMLVMFVHERMPAPNRGASRWGYIGNVFVLNEYRDSGIGAKLLAAATTYADENEFARLVLSPSERSVPFYDRAGFSKETT